MSELDSAQSDLNQTVPSRDATCAVGVLKLPTDSGRSTVFGALEKNTMFGIGPRTTLIQKPTRSGRMREPMRHGQLQCVLRLPPQLQRFVSLRWLYLNWQRSFMCIRRSRMRACTSDAALVTAQMPPTASAWSVFASACVHAPPTVQQ